ncbi:kinase-like protein, partial [Rhizophagus irregularis]
FGTSGSEIVDQFISKNKLKWIPYDKFKNIECLDKGGFGTTYKAKYNSIEVILKYFNDLNNSDESLNKFLNGWKIINSDEITKIYGFTKNSDTLNYVLIMEYINKEDIYGIFISDYLGLYQHAKSFLKENEIYGVLPFIAPEILRGQNYTAASDIYSFSIVMWEFTSGIPPFNDKAHDLQLALGICKGERPEIIENTPQ